MRENVYRIDRSMARLPVYNLCSGEDKNSGQKNIKFPFTIRYHGSVLCVDCQSIFAYCLCASVLFIRPLYKVFEKVISFLCMSFFMAENENARTKRKES